MRDQMRKYKYVKCMDIDRYGEWEIVEIIKATNNATGFNMAVLMKEDKPVQDYIKLHEATTEQILEEINKRLRRLNDN